MNTSNLFFKCRKLQIKQIQGKVWLSTKRFKKKGQKITAKDLKDQSYVNNIVNLNEGHRIFRTLCGSPPYWDHAKKDIFAMMRQLDVPTFYGSFSAAETRWKDLLRILGEVVDGKLYSEDEINEISWQKKCKLIKSDPVICCRYFDHRAKEFLRVVLQNKHVNVIGEVQDYFVRTEFQQRGSPHLHMLVWIKVN